MPVPHDFLCASVCFTTPANVNQAKQAALEHSPISDYESVLLGVRVITPRCFLNIAFQIHVQNDTRCPIYAKIRPFFYAVLDCCDTSFPVSLKWNLIVGQHEHNYRSMRLTVTYKSPFPSPLPPALGQWTAEDRLQKIWFDQNNSFLFFSFLTGCCWQFFCSEKNGSKVNLFRIVKKQQIICWGSLLIFRASHQKTGIPLSCGGNILNPQGLESLRRLYRVYMPSDSFKIFSKYEWLRSRDG